MEAVVFEQAGDAREVLALRRVDDPVPLAGHVVVAVESRTVQPSDLSFIRGAYRIRPVFPQIAGLSGAGRVVAVGEGVRLAAGTRVAFRSPGAWAELVSVPVERTFTVPEGVDIDLAAQFPLNPITAWGLLQMADVRRSDWIALSAAASSVAGLVNALAQERGIRVIGLARPSALADLAPGMVGIAVEDPKLTDRVREATGGKGVAAFLDSVGGPLLNAVFPTLEPGATIVAYGAMSDEPALVRNATLVYSNLTWRGFGIDRFVSRLAEREREVMIASLWDGLRAGRLPLPVRVRVALREFAEGLRLATETRGGKIVLA